jgi:hypothetical protein
MVSEAVNPVSADSGARNDIGIPVTHVPELLFTTCIILSNTVDAVSLRVIHTEFKAEYVLFIVDFQAVVVYPMLYPRAVIPCLNTGHHFRLRGREWLAVFTDGVAEIPDDTFGQTY